MDLKMSSALPCLSFKGTANQLQASARLRLSLRLSGNVLRDEP
ncbi:MAG TPA: hypothetical protein VGD40_06020 [Chryseosolibacter sp.]